MRPDKHINIHLLEVFVAVVHHQGYSGAQQELNLSTSAISNYMSELEGYIGFVLCQRGRSGFLLTEKGQQFFDQTMKRGRSKELFIRTMRELLTKQTAGKLK